MMKKVSGILVLLFGLIVTANAQSSNAAFVINPADDVTGTYSSFTNGDLYSGVFTLVETKSGNVNFSYHGELVSGETTLEKSVKESATQTILGYLIEYTCNLTPSGNISCKGTGV